ncbi:hypothetical protein ADIMK_1633 [Marinobacterium lacunae]|uniref:Uncharacterized protein n=1 Tax=Marinobacterium lacunae TaxID=1232683 RepID=A0A081G0T2_9GAMM|nr:hypothetical protein ADIMK_1633 [Marinobacterium lacunae]
MQMLDKAELAPILSVDGRTDQRVDGDAFRFWSLNRRLS